MAHKVEKAIITFLEGRHARTFVEVLFNPAEYTHEIRNNFKDTLLPGMKTPIVQFVNGETETLTLELLFDTWTNAGGVDVSKRTQELAKMLAIDDDLHAPPAVEFAWGSFIFKCVVQSLAQRFTMFNAGGAPVRATLNVTFKQYRTLPEQLRQPRRNSADKTKQRIFTADDSLWALAHREYGDVRQWRRIARANRVAAPRLVRPGAVLRLPPMEGDHGS